MKRWMPLILMIVLLWTGITPVLAQDDARTPSWAAARMDLYLAGLEVVGEALDREPLDLLLQLVVERTSINQVIADQGADAEAIAAALSTMIGLDAESVQRFLAAEYPLDVPGFVFGETGLAMPGADTPMMEPLTQLIWLVAAGSGLTVDEVQQRMADGESLHDIATSAGMDADELEQRLGAVLTERLYPEGVRSVEDFPDEAGPMVNAVFVSDDETLRARFQRTVLVNLIVVGAIAQELDVSRLDVRTSLEPGESFAAYLERSGGDVEAVQAVATEALVAWLGRFVEAGLLSEGDGDLMVKYAESAVENMLGRLLRHSPADPFGVLDAPG
ncbi:MAG: hypothetical protein HY866_10535 [Chloroflexi bacterium]|nr:hypothetical protein [Chloroflexota bacterium]